MEGVKNSSMWVTIPGMDEPGKIKAFFSTRHGGVSSFPYHSLNLSFQRADSRENVLENFRRLSRQTGIAIERMVISKQVHGDTVSVVDKSHCGMGLISRHRLGETDSLITAEKNIALVTFHADCTPVYLYDRKKQVIGLVHSGWRGTLLEISAKTVDMMKQKFHCNGDDIVAAIGPHIRKCCFEVDMDVYQKFTAVFPEDRDRMIPCGEKWKIDLGGIIRRTLLKKGIKKEDIHDIQRCTVCEKELFFSHRGGFGKTGTGAAFFMMVE